MDIPNSKSHKTLFARNLFFSSQVILKFYTEHGSATAMLCAKFQNDLMAEMSVMDLWAFSLRQVLDGYSILQQPTGSCTVWEETRGISGTELPFC